MDCNRLQISFGGPSVSQSIIVLAEALYLPLMLGHIILTDMAIISQKINKILETLNILVCNVDLFMVHSDLSDCHRNVML